MKRIAVLVLVLGVSLSGCETRGDAIPRRFAGEWDLNSEACADEDGVTRLSINEARLDLYEAHGTVLSVRPDGKRSVAVTMEWYDVDEDDDTKPLPDPHRVATLTLSEDREALRFAINGRQTPYVRCPGTPQ